ncbi:hypothetical protein [Woeseia oceani]|uniref:Uncharacterized protein n=1 Tax=Woeseia oceani TaxID=1548547 RepID=A0A193LHQ9_9GAMM|nr:hypothetical protein [Woeseia oceani]ANO52047.1 hypothetical protein BA177_13310 [Woeseia oceani]
MSKKVFAGSAILGVAVLLLGNTHRLLPAESDPCQQDMTHAGHVNDLPMFHCIGHTEYEWKPGAEGLEAVQKWDHMHPWMDYDWHIAQGFSAEQAARLVGKSQSPNAEY